MYTRLKNANKPYILLQLRLLAVAPKVTRFHTWFSNVICLHFGKIPNLISFLVKTISWVFTYLNNGEENVSDCYYTVFMLWLMHKWE